MADNSIGFTAVYDDVDSAVADLDALGKLHDDKVVGKYDAESSTMFSGGVTESAPASSDKYLPSVAAPSPAGAPPGVNRTWGDTLRGVGQTAVDFATAAGHSGTFGLDVRRDALAGWLAGDYPSYSAGVEAEQRKLAK